MDFTNVINCEKTIMNKIVLANKQANLSTDMDPN